MGTRIGPVPGFQSSWQQVAPTILQGGLAAQRGLEQAGQNLAAGVNRIEVRKAEKAKRAWMEGEQAKDRALRTDMAESALDMRRWELQARRDDQHMRWAGTQAETHEANAQALQEYDPEAAQAEMAQATKYRTLQDQIFSRGDIPPVAIENQERMSQRTWSRSTPRKAETPQAGP